MTMSDTPSGPPTSVEPPLPSPFIHTIPPPVLITQGAESHLYRTSFLTPSQPAALKVRPTKPYRHPTLDQRLTKGRVLAEARCLAKLGNVEHVRVPVLYALDWEVGRRV